MKEKWNNFKKGWNDFWDEDTKKGFKRFGIAMGISAALGFFTGCLYGLAENQKKIFDKEQDIFDKLDSYKESFDNLTEEEADKVKRIDEGVFTDIAPQLENVLLDDGIDSIHFDTSYDVGENTVKRVTIDVETIVGD